MLKFLGKSAQERGQLVKDKQGCPLCLSISHINQPCPFEPTWQKCDIGGCGKSHSRLLHCCTIVGFGAHISAPANNFSVSCHINETLHLFESVKVKTTSKSHIITFWDNGSQISLVTREYVTHNNLSGVL